MRPDFSKRLCGATYISQPMIGCTPCRRASSVNCTAPNMLPWSVIAQAGIPAARTRGSSSLILLAPSSSENCVWRCRWTNDIDPNPSSRFRPPDAGTHGSAGASGRQLAEKKSRRRPDPDPLPDRVRKSDRQASARRSRRRAKTDEPARLLLELVGFAAGGDHAAAPVELRAVEGHGRVLALRPDRLVGDRDPGDVRASEPFAEGVGPRVGGDDAVEAKRRDVLALPRPRQAAEPVTHVHVRHPRAHLDAPGQARRLQTRAVGHADLHRVRWRGGGERRDEDPAGSLAHPAAVEEPGVGHRIVQVLVRGPRADTLVAGDETCADAAGAVRTQRTRGQPSATTTAAMRATPATGVLGRGPPARTSTRLAKTGRSIGRSTGSSLGSSASSAGICTVTRFFASPGTAVVVAAAGAAAVAFEAPAAGAIDGTRGTQASISLRTCAALGRLAGERRIIRATSAETPGGRMRVNRGRSGPAPSSSRFRSSCSSAEEKNGFPSSISNRTSPSAKTSMRASMSSPIRRSGAAYASSVGGTAARPASRSALPKAASIACGGTVERINTEAGV